MAAPIADAVCPPVFDLTDHRVQDTSLRVLLDA
jgi:hypothetical protein